MKTFGLVLIAVPLYWVCDKIFGIGFYASLAVVFLVLLGGADVKPTVRSDSGLVNQYRYNVSSWIRRKFSHPFWLGRFVSQ